MFPDDNEGEPSSEGGDVHGGVAAAPAPQSKNPEDGRGSADQRDRDRARALLEDKPGREWHRRFGVTISVVCVGAAFWDLFLYEVYSPEKSPSFFWGLAWLILPMVIWLESASTRRYHQYRAALQALIQGRIDKQAEAAKQAAAAKEPKPSDSTPSKKQPEPAASAAASASTASPVTVIVQQAVGIRDFRKSEIYRPGPLER